MKFEFDSIESVIADIGAGKMVIVVDDDDRENEGDLIMAAQHATAEAVNFMASKGKGLICAPTTEERLRQLGIEEMVSQNRDSFKTDFQVSVDAARGISTGISAPDRAKTLLTLADPVSTKDDLNRPGHIFPLRAKAGGALQRAGHTEAAVDLVRLAGLRPVGVICEIMKDDGEMARLPDLMEFAKEHKLKICSIEDLIKFRRQREKLVELIEKVDMPTEHGDFKLCLYESKIDAAQHVALVNGDVTTGEPVLVRVHSECLTGDVFGSLRCDCGPQLHLAMEQIKEAGSGVILYMRQEGRGIGLASKIKSYKLQEMGYDTVDANLKLGFPMDLREYGVGAQILADLGLKKIKLMTNNPKKVVGLDGYGLEIVAQVPIKAPSNAHNEKYLQTKKDRMGHLI